MSIRIKSNLSCLNFSIASLPLLAVITLQPIFFSIRLTTFWFTNLSSAKSIFLFNFIFSFCFSDFSLTKGSGLSLMLAIKANQKLLPLSSLLSTPISPSISSISSFEIVSPNPNPSWFLVKEASTWENLVNNFFWSCKLMPMPVSIISIFSFMLVALRSVFDNLMVTVPSSVNLMALDKRLVSICLIRFSSATI